MEVSRQLHAPAALSIIQWPEGWVRKGQSRQSCVAVQLEGSPFLAYYPFGHIKYTKIYFFFSIIILPKQN